MHYDDGLKYAILAMSFFRGRNVRMPRFKKPNKAHAGMTVSCRAEQVRIARKYISLARKLGWRGSVFNAVKERGV